MPLCSCLQGIEDSAVDPSILLLPTETFSGPSCVFFGGTFQGANCDLNLKGIVTTIAGSGSAAHVDGPGTASSFDTPRSSTTDGEYVYISDSNNHVIRKLSIATREVTTLAGSGMNATVDGTGTGASFAEPHGITTPDGEYLYVSEKGGHNIRKIEIATGAVTTFAGAGAAGYLDATGTGAFFDTPKDLTNDGTYLYLVETGNRRVRRINISTAEVITLAGDGTAGTVDGFGTSAAFNNPGAVVTDGSIVYVGDQVDHVIRRIDLATTEVTTIAGSAGIAGATDATGTLARFSTPISLTMDGTNLYISDQSNDVMRKLVISTLEVTTPVGIAGASGYVDGTGTEVRFDNPRGYTTDGTYLYVMDALNQRIRRIE